LEGHLVFCHGRILEKKPAGDGLIDVLLKPATIREWNGFDAIGKDAPKGQVETDHLWLRMPKDSCAAEMLMKAYVIGEVYYYRRADFSVDLGIKSSPVIDLDLLFTEAQELYSDWTDASLEKAKEARNMLAVALDTLIHQGKEDWAWSRLYDLPEAAKRIARSLTRIHRSIEATEERLATVKTKGPCTGLDLFRAPKNQPRAAVGF